MRIPGSWESDNQKIFFYGEDGHVFQWHGMVKTNLFTNHCGEKNLAAYQVSVDFFYVVNTETADVSYGEPGDFIVWTKDKTVKVVKKADFTRADVITKRFPFNSMTHYFDLTDETDRAKRAEPEPKLFLRGYKANVDLESDDNV